MNSGYFCLHVYLPPDLKFDSVDYPRNMQDTRVEAAHSRCDLAAQPLAESGALIGAQRQAGRLETDSCWSDGLLLPGQLEPGYRDMDCPPYPCSLSGQVLKKSVYKSVSWIISTERSKMEFISVWFQALVRSFVNRLDPP